MDNDSDFTFVYDSEEHRAERKKYIGEVVQAIIDVAKTPQGKFFLRWLIYDECGFLNEFFPRDEKTTIWNLAKKDTALKIFKTVQAGGINDIVQFGIKE